MDEEEEKRILYLHLFSLRNNIHRSEKYKILSNEVNYRSHHHRQQ